MGTDFERPVITNNNLTKLFSEWTQYLKITEPDTLFNGMSNNDIKEQTFGEKVYQLDSLGFITMGLKTFVRKNKLFLTGNFDNGIQNIEFGYVEIDNDIENILQKNYCLRLVPCGGKYKQVITNENGSQCVKQFFEPISLKLEFKVNQKNTIETVTSPQKIATNKKSSLQNRVIDKGLNIRNKESLRSSRKRKEPFYKKLLFWIPLLLLITIIFSTFFLYSGKIAYSPNLIFLDCFGLPFLLLLIISSFIDWNSIDKNHKEYKAQKNQNNLKNFQLHCMNCNYPILHDEQYCPRCGILVQIPPEEMQRQQRNFLVNSSTLGKTSSVLVSIGNGLGKTGKKISNVGCFLTIFITIPIIIILFFILTLSLK